jgi:hypothetical protein
MEDSIFAQIRKENGDFFDNSISPVPGYDFNQYNTVKRCHLYRNSKYEDGSTYLGRKKLFFNVVNPPCEVATKMLNVDTKNIRLWPMNPKSYFATYLLEKELKQWLKTSEFAETLNKLAEELPIYGSVVLEKTKKGAKVVDIRRLVLDPSVESIEDSRFVTTIHYMTPTELRATGWDNVETAIERFGSNQAAQPFEDARGDTNQQDSTPYIKVCKRYGEVPEHWIKGKSEKMKRSVFIVAGADKVEVDKEGQKTGQEAGVVLFKSAWTKEWPYRDFHYTRVKGRWLGLGIVEMLFDVQVRMNELKNQKRVSMEISSMHLFQTKDKQIIRNIFTDLESGDMIQSPNGVEPVVTEERNLPAWNDEETSYMQQADRVSFAYQAMRGESPPSSTPLGTTQIVTAQASSSFAFKRENVAIAYREFFNELVMPQLISDLTPEHVMRFTGNSTELLALDQAACELYANDVVKESMLAGRLVTPQIVEIAKQKAMDTYKKMGSSRFLKMKQAFYKDAEYDFDYVIDNEQVDPQAMVTNLQKVISDLASAPQLLEDPRLKLLYFKFAQNLGVNAAELEMADEQAQKMKSEAEALPANSQTYGKNKALFTEAKTPAAPAGA